MKLKLAILPGDGIGPEIIDQAMKLKPGYISPIFLLSFIGF